MRAKIAIMRKMFLLLVLLVLCAGSCQKEQKNQEIDLATTLPGTWESVSINVKVNSVNNTDSSYVFDVPEKLWTKKLGVRPIKTYYTTENNNYTSEYYDLNDSLINKTRGKWYIFGDSLRLVTPEATYEYEVSVSGGLGNFRSLMDWDGDGQLDDEYNGVQRKISKYTNPAQRN